MRPIKLTMSAFGPYAGKVVLDMNSLGDRGIYLVTGDTGAGKTTIFDAICYALYGEASGEIRSSDLFRSKYADEDTPTFVEMEFLYRGELYIVKRNPEYLRPTKRGEARLVTEDAKALLEYPDGRIVSKVSDVTKAITELLGLDRKQFCQIAMIAQGDFLKLIMAKTDERRDIFREIFNTKAYLVLQEKLKSNSASLHNQYEDLGKGVAQYISGIRIEEMDPGYDELLDIKKKMTKGKSISSIADVLDKIEYIVNLDKDKLKVIDKSIKNYESLLEEINNKIVKVEHIVSLKKSIEDVTKEYNEEKTKIDKLRELFEEQESKSKEREKLAIEIAGEEEKLAKIIKYNDLLKNKTALEKSIKTSNDSKTEYANKVNDSENHIKEIKTYLEENTEETLRKEYEKISESKQELNNRASQLNMIKNKYKEYEKAYYEYKDVLKKYNKVRENYKEICDKYMTAETKFLDEQAGFIASKLEKDKPCPVCGSTIHPHKAALSSESITKDVLDKLKNEKAHKESEYNILSQEAGRIKGNLENVGNSLLEESRTTLAVDLEECGKENEVITQEEMKRILVGIQKKDEEIKLDVECIRKKDKEFTAREEERKTRLLKLNEYEQLVLKIKDSIAKIDEELIKQKADLDNISNSISDLQKDLTNTDLEEEKKLCEEKKALKNTLEQVYVKTKKDYENCKTNISGLEGKLVALSKELEKTNTIDMSLEELNQQLKENKDKLIQVRGNKENILVKIETNQNAYSNIKKKHFEIEEIEKKWTMVKALSNTANGNITGKKKVLLETYVQMAYFDRIIVKANTRLMRMTLGQYELIRKEDVKDSRSQIGLELDVIDHYNGTKRSVKSLSGGEAFKASLALALGLSDEIQSMAGGIQLDTMFIDEGFGALDDESLDNAIKTLNDLGKGSRLIGIISHVNELKTRIDKQIIVSKNKSGSFVDIVS